MDGTEPEPEALPGLVPLEGGWSGETFLSEVADERVVVRVYGGRSARRGPAAPEVDAAMLRLVRGLVPVPDVLEVRRGVPEHDRPGLLVTSYVAGRRGDLVLPHLGDPERRTLGRRIGALAATLAGMPTLRPGELVDGDLAIRPWGQAVEGLPGWVDAHAGHLVGWSAEEVRGLTAVAHEAQARLDTVERSCLVHSDLNPKNWLVDCSTLEVTALVDWEFAHSGHPCTDLGNAVRSDREPVWVDAVVAAYVERHGGEPGDVLTLARSADLWALVDLAARAAEAGRREDVVADTAGRQLRAIARTGDVHATA